MYNNKTRGFRDSVLRAESRTRAIPLLERGDTGADGADEPSSMFSSFPTFITHPTLWSFFLLLLGFLILAVTVTILGLVGKEFVRTKHMEKEISSLVDDDDAHGNDPDTTTTYPNSTEYYVLRLEEELQAGFSLIGAMLEAFGLGGTADPLAFSTGLSLSDQADTLLRSTGDIGSGECDSCPIDLLLSQEMEALEDSLRTRCDELSAVSWTTYHSNPSGYQYRWVHLTNADLAEGTARVTHPACILFQEDIIFDPNPGDDYKPTPSQTDYSGEAFRLGFFAAITVETEDVLIDLNGFELRQSKAHALMQRFYANIELTDQPFITGQGPADFGPDVKPAKRCVVTNGVLGRSSHHGIHGNLAEDIYLNHLVIQEYEVAALSLNGFRRLLVSECQMLGSATDVWVLGTWSNLRFIKDFIVLAKMLVAPGPELTALENAETALLAAEANVFEDLITNDLEEIDGYAHPDEFALFNNPNKTVDGRTVKVVDGNAYCILLNPLGVAVNGFFSDASSLKRYESHDVVIRNTVCRDTFAAVNEVVALRHTADGKQQLGPAGEAINFQRIVDQGTGAYIPDVISDAEFALAQAVSTLLPAQQAFFGTMHIDSEMIDWWNGVFTDIGPWVENGTFSYVRNGDTMFHVNKGVLALKADGILRLCVSDSLFENTWNVGEKGSFAPLRGENATTAWYFGASDGGHPAQGLQRGYMGADVRGIGLASTQRVYLSNVDIFGVHAKWGNAFGLHVFNYAELTRIVGVQIQDVTTLNLFDNPLEYIGEIAMGPKTGKAAGLVVAEDNSDLPCEERLEIDQVETAFVELAFSRLYTSGV